MACDEKARPVLAPGETHPRAPREERRGRRQPVMGRGDVHWSARLGRLGGGGGRLAARLERVPKHVVHGHSAIREFGCCAHPVHRDAAAAPQGYGGFAAPEVFCKALGAAGFRVEPLV